MSACLQSGRGNSHAESSKPLVVMEKIENVNNLLSVPYKDLK